MLSSVSSVRGCSQVKIPDDTDCAIVLGGDGTIIQTANDLIS